MTLWHWAGWESQKVGFHLTYDGAWLPKKLLTELIKQEGISGIYLLSHTELQKKASSSLSKLTCKQ